MRTDLAVLGEDVAEPAMLLLVMQVLMVGLGFLYTRMIEKQRSRQIDREREAWKDLC